MAERVHVATARGYEPDQPHLRGIAIGAGAIVLAVAVAVTTGVFVQRNVGPDATAHGDVIPPRVGGGPGLQATPGREIESYRAEKERLLHEYAWVDRSHGVVRIPIERAMALLVQQQAAKGGTR